MKKYDVFSKTNYISANNEIKSTLLFGTRKNKPLISIMIPTYNRFSLLIETVKSAAFQNDFNDYEVVIVDNSEIENNQIISWLYSQKADNVCYYKNETNIGMFGNWNRCIELANGEWILILNDDDMLANNYLFEMTSAIKSIPPETCLLGCQIENVFGNSHSPNFVDPSNKNTMQLKEIKMSDMYFCNFLSMSGTLFRKNSAIEIGGFNLEFYPISDFVFLINTIDLRKRAFQLQKKLFFYRIFDNESKKKETIVSFAYFENLIKKQINEKYHFLPRYFSDIYRQTIVSKFEHEQLNIWMSNSEEKSSLLKMFDELNYTEKIVKPSMVKYYCSIMLFFSRKLIFKFIRNSIKYSCDI